LEHGLLRARLVERLAARTDLGRRLALGPAPAAATTATTPPTPTAAALALLLAVALLGLGLLGQLDDVVLGRFVGVRRDARHPLARQDDEVGALGDLRGRPSAASTLGALAPLPPAAFASAPAR